MKKFGILGVIIIGIIISIGLIGCTTADWNDFWYGPPSGGGSSDGGGSGGGTQYTATFVNNSSHTVIVTLAWTGSQFSISPGGGSETRTANTSDVFTSARYDPADLVRVDVQGHNPRTITFRNR